MTDGNIRLIFFVCLLSVSTVIESTVHAATPEQPMAAYCADALESLPTLAGGRTKPLRVHAQDVLTFISGKHRCGALSATQAYCGLSLSQLDSLSLGCDLRIRVDHQHTRGLLGMGKKDGFIDPE